MYLIRAYPLIVASPPLVHLVVAPTWATSTHGMSHFSLAKISNESLQDPAFESLATLGGVRMRRIETVQRAAETKAVIRRDQR